MTYRDTEDALRARIEALESRLSHRALEQEELQQELSEAQRDLEDMHAVHHRRPRTLLTLGAVGVILAMVGLVLGQLSPVRFLWWTRFIHFAASVGLTLGLVGFYRVTRQRMMLASAVLLAAALLMRLTQLLVGDMGLGFHSYVPGWLLDLAAHAVLGVGLLLVPVTYLRSWKRVMAGVLALINVFLGTVSFVWITARVDAFSIYKYIDIPWSVVALSKYVGMLLCFLELRRPLPPGSR